MKPQKDNNIVPLHRANGHRILRSAAKSCASKRKWKIQHRKTLNNITVMAKMTNKYRIIETVHTVPPTSECKNRLLFPLRQ
jgi:hypothetical protein